MNSLTKGDLQVAVEWQLRELGYEICGDDEHTGWYWQLGGHASTSTKLAFDTIDQATADAVEDLVERSQELLEAAKQVLARWETGDLASAVRELDACVQSMAQGGDATAAEASDGASEPSVILDGAGAQIGQQAWLICGDLRDGPWTDEAHLDRDAAIERARQIGAEWIQDGIALDLEALAAALRRGQTFEATRHACMRLDLIDVIGKLA
jgi:hypothetical protein